MDIFEAVIAGLLIFCGVMVTFVVYEALQPVPAIEANDICSYKDMMVKTSVTPTESIRDETRFQFIILMPVPVGKSIMFIPIPIYDRFNVYLCKEGIHIAIDKSDRQPTIGKEICVCGKVHQDQKDNHLFVLEVREYC